MCFTAVFVVLPVAGLGAKFMLDRSAVALAKCVDDVRREWCIIDDAGPPYMCLEWDTQDYQECVLNYAFQTPISP